MNKKECLEKAIEICSGARQEAYGKPENNFENIAELWNTYLERRFGCGDRNINVADVAIMMILMKCARLITNPTHIDSWIDICGYGANGAEVTSSDE